MLQLRNITKTYKNGSSTIIALNNISLDLPDKGLVFIVGKSGAGKSTLLNIMGGLDKMDSGEMIVDGKSTKNFNEHDYDALRNYQIGFIFQEFNLIDDISVYENIALSLKIQSKGHDATTIDEALKMVNLEGLGYRIPNELSGGQKQRIAIARALVKNPNMVLADEPTGALDSKTGYELVNSLKMLSKEKLIVVVTHDEDLAFFYGDLIIRLQDGKIIEKKMTTAKEQKDKIQQIDSSVLKIAAGEKINDIQSLNAMLHNETEDTNICITDTPELVTLAKPEIYDAVFEKKDYRSQFVDFKEPLLPIAEQKKENIKRKANLKAKECIKMAFDSYKKSKGRIVFLLIFTILCISLLGLTASISTISNPSVITNTLKNNDMELGILQKSTDLGPEILSDSVLNELHTMNDSSNYALSKKMSIPYTSTTKPSTSSFAMNQFTGIVECNNLEDMNLKPVIGRLDFTSSSLENHEIILSDYAAYEIARTGYFGRDAQGVFGIVKPLNNEEVVESYILIGTIEYKIIGIFQTNFENYLPLLVNEIYSGDESSQSSSLEALKSYYYARIFAPNGFYKQINVENKTIADKGSFTIYSSTVEVPSEDSDTGYILSPRLFTTGYLTTFSSDYKSYGNYSRKYGQLPTTLQDNQIIINYAMLTDFGISTSEDIDQFIHTLGNVYINKYNADNQVESVLNSTPLEVVAILSFSTTSSVPYFFFSENKATSLNDAINSYNQVLFTLNGSRSSYKNTISKVIKNGYDVLNIDGTTSFNTSDISQIKSIALVASLVIALFSFLIILNFVSSNVKFRKKEIGILRANGARKKDILNIFFVEEGLIALVTAFFSILIAAYLSTLFNSLYGNMQIGIQPILFSLTNILTIIVITLFFIGIATIIPVLSIVNLKPIDAIKQI